jgi:hypothetical protein
LLDTQSERLYIPPCVCQIKTDERSE